jgi:hypothetical protein
LHCIALTTTASEHPILIQTAQYNLIIDAGIGNGKLSEKQLRNFGVDEESHIIADFIST